MTDPLPPNMKVADPANASTTCGGSPVVTAIAAANSASLNGAVIPANQQCDMVFDVVTDAGGGGNWTNVIPVGNVTAAGGVQNMTPVTAVLTNGVGSLNVSVNTGPNSLRSEEHTSELQSLMRISYAVFCLKKKNTKY